MKMKQSPEDFIVNEIPLREPTGEGEYTWFTLRKKNWELLKVLDILSKKCNVSRNRFGYAGLKDKNAITYQKISAWKIHEKTLKSIKLKDIELSDFDESSKPIKLGQLKGNKFKIAVRDLSRKDLKNIDQRIKSLKKGILNRFDEQRFGKNKNNHIIGKYIIKRDFRKAVALYLKADPKWKRSIGNYLSKNKDDFEGAINTLPKTLKMLFVHAYQSYLWNIMTKSSKSETVPIIGYSTQMTPQIKKILEKEDITLDMFKGIFESISFSGDYRKLIMHPKRIKWSVESDELNKYKNKLLISFELTKGSYATQAVKSLFYSYK